MVKPWTERYYEQTVDFSIGKGKTVQELMQDEIDELRKIVFAIDERKKETKVPCHLIESES